MVSSQIRVFTYNWSEAFLNGEVEGEQVRLPHTVNEIPLHYASPEYYETVSGYRRKLDILPEYERKRLFLRFDGAAHIAYVFVNGRQIFEHRCGYTAFEVEITDYVDPDGENYVAVKLDSTENPAIPPCGAGTDGSRQKKDGMNEGWHKQYSTVGGGARGMM